MKNISIITFSIFLINTGLAQNFMTNKLEHCLFKTNDFETICSYMLAISQNFDANIRIEVPESYAKFGLYETMEFIKNTYSTNKIYTLNKLVKEDEIHVENAVCGDMFEACMRHMSELEWRYEKETNAIYIQPKTNAISSMRLGSVFYKKTLLSNLFDESDILGFKSHGFILDDGMGDKSIVSGLGKQRISFESDDACIWEVFDSIIKQITNCKSWIITHIEQGNEKIYKVQFTDRVFDIHYQSIREERRIQMESKLSFVKETNFSLKNVLKVSSDEFYKYPIMTNKIEKIHLRMSEHGNIYRHMGVLAHVFNVKIRIEAPDLYQTEEMRRTMIDCDKSMIYTNMYKHPTFYGSIYVTNAVFGDMFNIYMSNTTNLTWRYDNNADSIYIYPVTNAFSMLRLGAVSFTNAPLRDLFNDVDVLGLKKYGVELGSTSTSDGWSSQRVSFESDDAYLWEVLDEIVKYPRWQTWEIIRKKTNDKSLYKFNFVDKWGYLRRSYD